MSGDHNMYCSANQPDLIETLRETSAEIVKDTLPRWKNLDEYMDEAADEIERLREKLAYHVRIHNEMYNRLDLWGLVAKFEAEDDSDD